MSQADPEAERIEHATAVGRETLKRIGTALTRVPAGFEVHPRIARQLEAKREMLESGGGIDWTTGEALAFGSLLLEGHRVRLSGEDSQRGTFSQRHAVLIDQVNQNEYVPLNNIARDQARIEIYNSLLSEAGVLGFEYGYTLADPRTLVMWEAQFGDFANGAQVIIDQFLASGESKWLRMSGLTLLLPHGYEGQGPEHSSARIERYLQLCAERNMCVANLTTPANYFHALRRQLKRNFRKPLVIFTPKSLLRHKLAVSSLDDMAEGSAFRFVIPEIVRDRAARAGEARRAVLRQGVLRSADRAAREVDQRRGYHAARTDLSVPGEDADSRTDTISRRRIGLVSGGTGEHGRLELRRSPARKGARRNWRCWQASASMSVATRPPAPPPVPPARMVRNRRRWSRPRWEPRDMATEINVPTLGESVTSATVARWMKHEGEAVAADEPLVELETDKVTVEVNAPSAGVLTSISAPEGSEVPVGALLGLLEAGATAATAAPKAAAVPAARAITARAASGGDATGRCECAASRPWAGRASGHAAGRRGGSCPAAGRGKADRGTASLGRTDRRWQRQGRSHHQR